MSFENKVALVTGAAQGIGEAVAINLVKNGARVFLVDVDEVKLIEVMNKCHEINNTAQMFICDISDEKQVKKCVEKCLDTFGEIDILINNAGIYAQEKEFSISDRASWNKLIDINIYGSMYFIQEVLPIMEKKKSGHIVNLASVAAVYGISYMPVYSLTKGAILALTRALAKSLGSKGITINCVSPGNIHPGDPYEQTDEHKAMSFLGRTGTPEECANVICFLASDESSFVSGQNYIVDGCRKVM